MEQLSGYAALDPRKFWEMTPTEHHFRSIFPLRRPLCIKASFLGGLPAQAPVTLICLDQEHFEEVPRHPLCREDAALVYRLLGAWMLVCREILSAHGVVYVVIRELGRDVV